MTFHKVCFFIVPNKITMCSSKNTNPIKQTVKIISKQSFAWTSGFIMTFRKETKEWRKKTVQKGNNSVALDGQLVEGRLVHLFDLDLLEVHAVLPGQRSVCPIDGQLGGHVGGGREVAGL